MPFKIVRNDITKMKVDAVVNTANEAPIYSSGVDCAIYKAAGEKKLLKLREAIGYMDEGEVAITPGLKLPAKYIIHAVSPLYLDGNEGEEDKLRSCYRKSLELAYEKKCKSIAFPLISTGSFGYPKEEGMRIAIDEINGFLLKKDMLVYLVVFGGDSTKLGRNLYPDLKEYIDNNYVEEKYESEYSFRGFRLEEKSSRCARRSILATEESSMQAKASSVAEESSMQAKASSVTQDASVADEAMPIMANASMSDFADCEDDMWAGLEDYDEFIDQKESAIKERMKHLSDTFTEYLIYIIGQKGLSNVDVYKRAILDKRQFSKIKNNKDYHPDKGTALRLCVGAKLNLDETKDLLARAGYALSPCDKRDIIFSYFIERGVYDVMEIDITLEEYGLPCFIA